NQSALPTVLPIEHRIQLASSLPSNNRALPSSHAPLTLPRASQGATRPPQLSSQPFCFARGGHRVEHQLSIVFDKPDRRPHRGSVAPICLETHVTLADELVELVSHL